MGFFKATEKDYVTILGAMAEENLAAMAVHCNCMCACGNCGGRCGCTGYCDIGKCNCRWHHIETKDSELLTEFFAI